jgi:hypothetical protein
MKRSALFLAGDRLTNVDWLDRDVWCIFNQVRIALFREVDCCAVLEASNILKKRCVCCGTKIYRLKRSTLK